MASLLLLTLIKSLPPVAPRVKPVYQMKPLEAVKAKRFAPLFARIEKAAKEVREAAFVQHLKRAVPRAGWAHLNASDRFITERREALAVAQQAERSYVLRQAKYYGLRTQMLPH